MKEKRRKNINSFIKIRKSYNVDPCMRGDSWYMYIVDFR